MKRLQDLDIGLRRNRARDARLKFADFAKRSMRSDIAKLLSTGVKASVHSAMPHEPLLPNERQARMAGKTGPGGRSNDILEKAIPMRSSDVSLTCLVKPAVIHVS
ncbi:hypothetical protein LXA43DRAFT_1094801 [Ganoderma leucocontextum]|nr:hypothetical protein LXA43DRAFT_1094801 [Ganoderma leucocontextum]